MPFAQRADGLVDVDTPAGPMPMAPEMAMQLGWTPGTPEATVTPPPAQMATSAGLPGAPMGLSPEDMSTLGLPPQEQAAAHAYADPALASAMNSTDASQLAKQVPMQAAPAQQVQVASGPGPMEKLALSLPGGRESSTTNRTGPAPITGPRRAAIEQAQDAQLAAMHKSATAEGAMADALTQQARLEATQARAAQEADALRRQRIDANMAKMQAKREELRRAVPDKIDQDRWNKLGGVGSVLAAVSVALGGFAQGLNGGDNPGMSIINDLISRDVQAQKEEIALAQATADTADNDLQRYMDIFGDPILAEKQLEMNGLETMKKEMQARVQGAQSEQSKAIAAQGIAAVEEKIQVLRNDMDGRGGTIAQQSQFEGESAAETQGRIMAGRAQDQSVNDPFANMDDRSKRDAIARLVVLPSGQKGFAPTDDEGKAMRAAKVAYDQYAENVTRLLEMAEQGENLTMDGRGEMEALIQDNAIAIKNIKELGALVGADWGIVDPLSGKGVKDLIAPGAKQMIRTSKSRMADELTKKWGTLLDAPFSTNLLNPTGGVQELPGPGD
jgi:hypothetical protein